VDTWGIGSEGVAEGISTGQLGSRTCCQRDFHRTFGVENVLPNHTGGGGLLVGFRLARHCAHRWGGVCLWVFGWQGIAHTGVGVVCLWVFGWQGIAHTGGGVCLWVFSVGKALRTPVGGVGFGLARRRVSRWEGFVLVGGISGSVRNKQDLECFVVENQRIDQSCCVC